MCQNLHHMRAVPQHQLLADSGSIRKRALYVRKWAQRIRQKKNMYLQKSPIYPCERSITWCDASHDVMHQWWCITSRVGDSAKEWHACCTGFIASALWITWCNTLSVVYHIISSTLHWFCRFNFVNHMMQYTIGSVSYHLIHRPYGYMGLFCIHIFFWIHGALFVDIYTCIFLRIPSPMIGSGTVFVLFVKCVDSWVGSWVCSRCVLQYFCPAYWSVRAFTACVARVLLQCVVAVCCCKVRWDCSESVQGQQSQHTVTHCSTLQHTVSHYNTLQRTCKSLQSQRTSLHVDKSRHIYVTCERVVSRVYECRVTYELRSQVEEDKIALAKELEAKAKAKGGMLWHGMLWHGYVVATISSLLKIIALFCRISSLL